MGKIVRRVGFVITVVLAGAIVLLAGSIVVDGFGSAARLDAVTNVTLPNASGPAVRAYVARPAGAGPHPAVIMVHEFFGLNQSLREKADLLAESGYVVIAPDVFRGSTTDWIPHAIYQVISTPADQVNQDLDAVFAWLADQPDVQADRIAVAGFCFGGRTALLYSLHNPQLAGTVIFYGGPVTEAERLRALPGPVLGLYGGADNSIPLADVRAFDAALAAAGVPHTVHVFGGQPHAFVNSVAEIRRGGVQGQAWGEMRAFLAQTLQGPAGRQPAHPAARADDFFGWLALARLALAHAAPHAH